MAVALAECCICERQLGVKVDLASPAGLPPEFVLFGEDASRIVISCDPGKLARIKQVAETHGISADAIGETVSEQLEIKSMARSVICGRFRISAKRYEGALERAIAQRSAVAG